MKNKNLRFHLWAIPVSVFVFLLAFSAAQAQTKTKNRVPSSKDSGIAAMEYVTGMRVNPATGTIDTKDVQKAQASATALMQAKGKADLTWESRGPINLSGRISTFIFDLRDESGNTIYAVSPSGGIWKSENGGLTYELSIAEETIFKASNLYQADNGDLYACTGEASDALRFSGYGAFMGDGIYKSTDGYNYTRLEGTNPNGNEDSPWVCVFDFAIKNNTYYAATIQGLYLSTDNGVTWSVAMDEEGNEMNGVCTNVQVTPSGKILVAHNSHMYVTQGENNFTNYSNRYIDENDSVINPESLPRDGIAYLTFKYASSDENIIYAIACNVDDPQTGGDENDEYGTLEGIYASFDGGTTWETIGPGSSEGFMVFTTNNGPYTAAIGIDPQDPYHVVIGGTNLYNGTFVDHGSFYRWIEVTSSDSPIYYIPANKHEILYHPKDNQTILTATDAGIFSMNMATSEIKPLFKGLNTSNCYSVNAGFNGSLIASTQSLNSIIAPGTGTLPLNGYSIQQPYYTHSQTGARSYHSFIYPIAIIYSNDGVSEIDYFRVDDQESQHMVFSTDQVVQDAVRNKDKSFQVPTLLWESFNNPYSRDSLTFKAKEATPQGTVVTVTSPNGKYPVNFELPYDLPYGNDSSITFQDPISSKMFVALKGSVYMTLDAINFFKDPEWFLISDSVENDGVKGVASAIGLTENANHLFVGTEDGRLFRISNLSLAYNKERADVTSPDCIISTELIHTFEEGRVITSIATDPNDKNSLVVTLGNYGYNDYVFFCDNAIDEHPTFTSIQGALPKAPVYSSVIEMNNSNMVIVGTEYGIYVTESTTSPNWAYASTGLGSVPVFELKQQTITHYPIITEGMHLSVTNYGVIYAATGGRGLFESRAFVGINDYDTPSGHANLSNLHVYPNPVETTANVQFDANEPGIGMINIFNLSGRVVKSETIRMTSAGSKTFPVDMTHFTPGAYVIQVVLNGQSATAKVMIAE